MNKEDLITKALELATKVHINQFRKNGNIPYIEHPKAVCEIAKQFINENNDRLFFSHTDIINVQIIAILHDTIEDCTPDIYDRDKLIIDIFDTFGHTVGDCILQLTKNKQFDNYATYINRLTSNGHLFSLIVKLADLRHNMSDLQEGAQLDKYRLAAMMVSRAINQYCNEYEGT